MFSRQDGVGTVTQEEKESFGHVKERLRILLECHLMNLWFVFPFGRPEGALKSTISLLERVSIKKLTPFLVVNGTEYAQKNLNEIADIFNDTFIE